jgi:hypothetical protein
VPLFLSLSSPFPWDDLFELTVGWSPPPKADQASPSRERHRGRKGLAWSALGGGDQPTVSSKRSSQGNGEERGREAPRRAGTSDDKRRRETSTCPSYGRAIQCQAREPLDGVRRIRSTDSLQRTAIFVPLLLLLLPPPPSTRDLKPRLAGAPLNRGIGEKRRRWERERREARGEQVRD